MPTFSLIIPTLGRTDELATLFSTLNEQGDVAIEVIVVDQNVDDRVKHLYPLLGTGITVRHLRQMEPHVSRARNLGLAYATGDFVAFPDDDCWYPSELLGKVDRWFGQQPQYEILSVGAQDEEGLVSGNRWPQSRCDIRPYNCLRTTFCNSLFIRRSAIPTGFGFDIAIRHGEETDFVLHLLRAGCHGRFDRSLHVGHPRRDMLSGTVSHSRALQYGEGMGRLVRRHSLRVLWGGLLAYEVLRAVAVILKGDVLGARICISHLRGLVKGFIFPYRGNYQAV